MTDDARLRVSTACLALGLPAAIIAWPAAANGAYLPAIIALGLLGAGVALRPTRRRMFVALGFATLWIPVVGPVILAFAAAGWLRERRARRRAEVPDALFNRR